MALGHTGSGSLAGALARCSHNNATGRGFSIIKTAPDCARSAFSPGDKSCAMAGNVVLPGAIAQCGKSGNTLLRARVRAVLVGANPTNYRLVKRRYRSRHPERARAHMMVRDAIKRGELSRKPCAVCNGRKSEAHHDDYERPLDVVWLCRQHHRERHAR